MGIEEDEAGVDDGNWLEVELPVDAPTVEFVALVVEFVVVFAAASVRMAPKVGMAVGAERANVKNAKRAKNCANNCIVANESVSVCV